MMEKRVSVILADASEDYRNLLKKTMENAGDFQVVGSTGSGTDALHLIQQMQPQLVVMDLVLPELDGFGLLRKLKEMGAHAPRVLVVSAFCAQRTVYQAVELGVYEIVPVMMKRCVVKLSEAKKIQKKTERWQAIAEAAAKQCDRGMIPVVHTPVTMEQAFDMASSLEYNMIPYELQDGIQVSRQIVEEACSKESVGIFIGPEGGLEKEEVEKAMEIGAKPITLGKRILRTETAGMALLSIMMFQLQK